MKHILFVDDDISLAELVTELLQDAGFSVTTVHAPQRFYKELDKHSPDLILMDYWLPDENGEMITKKIKKNKLTSSIPIIMISSNHSVEKIAKNIGVDGYFSKPFDIDKLIHRINSLTA